jgi:hypothetical protein
MPPLVTPMPQQRVVARPMVPPMQQQSVAAAPLTAAVVVVDRMVAANALAGSC